MPHELAVVGMNYREASTALRAKAAAVDRDENGPSGALLTGKFATGIVRIETCSRSEWVISAHDGKWAAELFRAALLSRLQISPEPRLHKKCGSAAIEYLLRVAIGLDAVNEGEAAVGKQVLRAFTESHAQGHTDRILNLAWNEVGKLLHHKRRVLPARPHIGIQKLVLEQLLEQSMKREAVVCIFGAGQIGRAVFATLQQHSFAHVHLFSRATQNEFLQMAPQAAAVIVASGAPDAWLTVPKAQLSGCESLGVCIDVGSPNQVISAEGRVYFTLDHLLARPGCLLPENEYERLLALIETHAEILRQRMLQPDDGKQLQAMAAERKNFLHSKLPQVLAEVSSPDLQKSIRKEIHHLTHALLKRAQRGER